MRIIEKLSTVCVIAMAIAVLITLYRSNFQVGRNQFDPRDQEKGFVGKTIDLRSPSQAARKVTLIAGISTNCHFCSQNLGLYKRLAAMQNDDFRFVLALPQPQNEAQDYAARNGLHPEVLLPSTLDRFGITATPTILTLDQRGVVTSAWVGALDETREKALMDQLIRQCNSCVAGRDHDSRSN